MASRLDARRALAVAAGPDPASITRALWWTLGLIAVAVLVTARLLTPDPAGHGTHTQLGLPPCGFLWLTSLPCPACGLTTAFAHIARLDITPSVHAHPLGVPLFVATLAAVPTCAWAGVRRWPLAETLERFQAQRVAIVFASATALAWAARVCAIVLD